MCFAGVVERDREVRGTERGGEKEKRKRKGGGVGARERRRERNQSRRRGWVHT